MFEDISFKWLTLYYLVLGMLCTGAGLFWLVWPKPAARYIQEQTSTEEIPPLLKNILKYLFILSIPTFIFSFYPFSWVQLLFSLWLLFMIYISGSLLLKWEEIRSLIIKSRQDLNRIVRWGSVIMLSVGLLMLLLFYQMINQFLFI